jgi:hypothetical protein
MKRPPGVVKLERAVSFQEGALGFVVSRIAEVATDLRMIHRRMRPQSWRHNAGS